MGTKFKLLFTVTLMLLGLAVATMINVSLNFRDYSLKSATEKATTTAAIVKDGLTAHMVNGIMDKRQYFLNQISNNNSEVKSLWIVRSPSVEKQYGSGFTSETVRDKIDKEVLQSGKMVKKIHESPDAITLRVSIPYKATTTQPNCLRCHNIQRGNVLGVISMEFDITHMRNDGMLTILKILILNLVFIVIVLFLINRYVSPYMKLFASMQEGITKAYSGDFTHKFFTNVKGDASHITEQLNTLFSRIQETFGNIKDDLSTFIPQGRIASKDPLFEARTIINELSDIYKFKKTIELDTSKKVVYSRLIHILEKKYELKHFAIYEINNYTSTRTLVYISEGKSICNHEVDKEAGLCRAYRNKTDVISTEFDNLCQSCHANNLEYLCIPFGINQDNSLMISITTQSKEELEKINAMSTSIKNYLEAIKPVLESKILMDKLLDTSLRDAMTGLYNRRFLDEFIDKVMSQALRGKESYSVLMLDIDFFKLVNDTYGHDVGDKVIVEIGKLVRASIRESDLGIRYGGEEFVIMLHNADDVGTLKVAQAIHDKFGELVFDAGNGETLQKTMSIGISKFPTDGKTIWKAIKFADTALYVAKTTGRDKIVEYKKEMSESEAVR